MSTFGDLRSRDNLSKTEPAKFQEMKRRLKGYREAAAPSLGGRRRKPADFKTPQRWGHPDKK